MSALGDALAPRESAVGPTRKSGDAILTSVLPSTADIRQRGGHVRKVPDSEVPDVENDANRFLEIVVVLKSFGMTITISSC
jgi:hypothetical protein